MATSHLSACYDGMYCIVQGNKEITEFDHIFCSNYKITQFPHRDGESFGLLAAIALTPWTWLKAGAVGVVVAVLLERGGGEVAEVVGGGVGGEGMGAADWGGVWLEDVDLVEGGVTAEFDWLISSDCLRTTSSFSFRRDGSLFSSPNSLSLLLLYY